jgi:hypothetical protein
MKPAACSPAWEGNLMGGGSRPLRPPNPILGWPYPRLASIGLSVELRVVWNWYF